MKLRASRTEIGTPWEPRQQDAWTALEALGALAMVGFLLAILLPTIGEVIQKTKTNSLIKSVLSVRTASNCHAQAYLALNSLFGTNNLPTPIGDYVGTVLIPEGFLDHPFHPPVGGPIAVCQLVTGPASNNGQGYWFTGVGTSPNFACSKNFAYVVECVMTNVSFLDAGNCAWILDQATLTTALDGYLDTAGKIDYSTNNHGTLRVFVCGR